MKSTPLLDRVSVAKPCPADWDRMPGDARVRFCSQCDLHVYNISAMPAAEGEALIRRTEGRVCVRLYRRTDGTVLTADCPVGLRLWRRRVSRAAGAFLTALLSLFTGSPAAARGLFAQGSPVARTELKVTRKKSMREDRRSVLGGTIFDINEAVIAGARVTLVSERDEKKRRSVETNDEGRFLLSGLEAGSYTVVVEANGFAAFKEKGLKVEDGEDLSLDLTLEVAAMGEIVIVNDGSLPLESTPATPLKTLSPDNR